MDNEVCYVLPHCAKVGDIVFSRTVHFGLWLIIGNDPSGEGRNIRFLSPQGEIREYFYRPDEDLVVTRFD